MPTYLSEEESARYEAFQIKNTHQLKSVNQDNAQDIFEQAGKAFFLALNTLNIDDPLQVDSFFLTVSLLCHSAAYLWAESQMKNGKKEHKAFDDILNGFSEDKLIKFLEVRLSAPEFLDSKVLNAKKKPRKKDYEEIQDFTVIKKDLIKIVNLTNKNNAKGKAWEGLLLRAQYIAEICIPGIFPKPKPSPVSPVAHKKK